MITWFDILPEEILQLIYKCLFSQCLEELVTNYSREWIEGGMSKYQCADCCPRKPNYYPYALPYKCDNCRVYLCRQCSREIIYFYTQRPTEILCYLCAIG